MANEQYLKLGDSIDRNSNGIFDTGDGLLLVGANVGDLAQKAAVAYTVRVVYEQINAVLPGTQAQVISQMYLLATAPTTADPLVQNLSPDPYATIPSGDPYVDANQSRLNMIFQCAGLSLP
jgi:predicted LPLAT superfamily acyltransferase